MEERPLQSILKSAEQTKKERICLNQIKRNSVNHSEPFRNNRNFRLSHDKYQAYFFTYESAFASTLNSVNPLTQRSFTDLREEEQALSKISHGFLNFSNLSHWSSVHQVYQVFSAMFRSMDKFSRDSFPEFPET